MTMRHTLILARQNVTQKNKDLATRTLLQYGVYTCVVLELEVPAPLVALVELLQYDTHII